MNTLIEHIKSSCIVKLKIQFWDSSDTINRLNKYILSFL